MRITCQNCNKKFNINEDLIPDKGRLLQCGSCNHKWFFKNEAIPEFIQPIKNENFEIFDPINIKESKNTDGFIDLNNSDKTSVIKEETKNNKSIKDTKNKKKTNILNLTIVFIISFIALIILIDTFERPLSVIFPNIEFFLFNLNESIKDIILFAKDLI